MVLGASSGQARAVRAAQLLERGFGGNGLGWLKPALGTVDNLVPIDASPPNLRDEMCSGKRKRPATDEDADIVAANGGASSRRNRGHVLHRRAAAADGEAVGTAGCRRRRRPSRFRSIPARPRPAPALIAAVAADTEKQTPAKRGKKSQVAAKKPDAAAAPKAEAKAQAGGQAGCRSPARQAGSRGKPAAKPGRLGRKAGATPTSPPPRDKAAPKPAKPKAAAKPKGETKPAG